MVYNYNNSGATNNIYATGDSGGTIVSNNVYFPENSQVADLNNKINNLMQKLNYIEEQNFNLETIIERQNKKIANLIENPINVLKHKVKNFSLKNELID